MLLASAGGTRVRVGKPSRAAGLSGGTLAAAWHAIVDNACGVWPLALRLAQLARRSLGVVGLLVAAWLVLLGLRVLRTGEGGDTWLLVAGLAWRGAALPTVRAAAR